MFWSLRYTRTPALARDRHRVSMDKNIPEKFTVGGRLADTCPLGTASQMLEGSCSGAQPASNPVNVFLNPARGLIPRAKLVEGDGRGLRIKDGSTSTCERPAPVVEALSIAWGVERWVHGDNNRVASAPI